MLGQIIRNYDGIDKMWFLKIFPPFSLNDALTIFINDYFRKLI